MKFISKINSIFGVKKVKNVQGAEIYSVSWLSRFGDFHSETKPVYKAFLTKEDAEEFAQSLRDAHKLLQNTNSIKITITKQE